jgi:hypothetical protein
MRVEGGEKKMIAWGEERDLPRVSKDDRERLPMPA